MRTVGLYICCHTCICLFSRWYNHAWLIIRHCLLILVTDLIWCRGPGHALGNSATVLRVAYYDSPNVLCPHSNGVGFSVATVPSTYWWGKVVRVVGRSLVVRGYPLHYCMRWTRPPVGYFCPKYTCNIIYNIRRWINFMSKTAMNILRILVITIEYLRMLNIWRPSHSF